MNWFSVTFLLVLIVGVVLELWLNWRQARSVRTHRERVPTAFAGHIPLQAHQKAADYTQARLSLARWQIVLSALLVLGWTLAGGLEMAASLIAAAAWGPLATGTAIVLAVLLINGLVELPLGIWSTFGIEQRFGFNRSTPARFIRDKLLQALLLLLLGSPLLLAILWLMQVGGEMWWLLAWGVWVGFLLLLTWIHPNWIAPLFNRFKPLPEGPLKKRLEQLLAACEFENRGMYVMDGSTRTSHGNAYFTGFGRNRRIVFFDTLLDGLEDNQVEAVLAHELGHFKRRHVPKRLILNTLMSLLGLGLLGWLAQQGWFYAGLGVETRTPATALVLFLLVAPAFTLFLSPLLSMLSRRHEFEADAFAAQYTSADALSGGLLRMYRDNASTLTPDRLYSLFHHSHPPAAERIARLRGSVSTDTPLTDPS